MYYVTNLYENIIKKNASNNIKIRVLSGYSSANFVNLVLKDFPHIQIELYIGMAFQGIKKKDHVKYKEMSDKQNLNVFYQVDGIPNHMKVLEFSNQANELTTFVGSANFSQQGFLFHKELMTLQKRVPNELFENQYNQSMSCLNPNVEKYINFYQDNGDSLDYAEFLNRHTLLNETSDKMEPDNLGRSEKWREIRFSTNIVYYNTFYVEILPSMNNEVWKYSGINSWVNSGEPVLIQTPRLMFDQVFPENDVFYIYTDDGLEISATLSGHFNKYLKFNNVNIYEYVKKRIGIHNKRPIHYMDLLSYGCTNFYFERIEKNIFLMSFQSKYLK